MKDYYVAASTQIKAVRAGWPGVWDAVKRAWNKDRSATVLETVTFSLYVRTQREPDTFRLHAEQGGEDLRMYGCGVYSLGNVDPGYIGTSVKAQIYDDGSRSMHYSAPDISKGTE